MNWTSTTTTNGSGVITRTTVVHPISHYILPALGVVIFLLLAWALGRAFREKG